MEEAHLYGPLQYLIGTWKGSKGEDVSATAEGEIRRAFMETLIIEPIGCVANTHTQELAVLRYHQSVLELENHCPIHDEVGYWIWDEAKKQVMNSFSIPRGLNLLAGGSASEPKPGLLTVEVNASLEHPNWTIAQSPFMDAKAKVTGFKRTFTINGDQLHYHQTTKVDIYDKHFDHTDENTLQRQG